MQIKKNTPIHKSHTCSYTIPVSFFIEFSERISFDDRQDNKDRVRTAFSLFFSTMPVVCLLSCVSQSSHKSKQKLNFILQVCFIWHGSHLNNKQINQYENEEKKKDILSAFTFNVHQYE